jgi:hypothetical protein
MLAFLIRRIRATMLRNLESLVCKFSKRFEISVSDFAFSLTELNANELSPTSEEFDCIRIVARNSSGNIITVPIKVGRKSAVADFSELNTPTYSEPDIYLLR